MKLSTVNVIVCSDDTIFSVSSFKDDEIGNSEAESLYATLAQERGFTDADIQAGLDNGFLEKDDFNLYIVHSS
jgi:hypothetical protein